MSDNTKTQIKVSGKEAFFTRKIANDGVRFPICLPTGEETDQWLLLHSSDSDAWGQACLANERRKKDIEQLADDGEKRKAKREAGRRLTASLVCGWSFPEPCTQESVLDMLYQAQYLEDDIDAIALNRQRFYAGASSNLPGTPKRPTDSTDLQPKDPSSPSDST
jgi:hypothetical protein